ncbi:protein borderless-like isoform X4 [Linepithema humile]|uniref:protein borderless-like isoform X4 n=1 Tax=Linepithema humile TaxID=83485 RepID=UPI00351DBBBE
MLTSMKFFRVILALLGGTHVLYAQPSASPTVKTGGSSIASVVAGSKPTRSWDNKPQFDDIAPRNVTAIVGQTAELNCYVKHPGDRVVSWIRKRDLHILTSSIHAYTGDARFSVKHPEASDEWTLKIAYVQPRDAGVYECQVNTEPKMNLAFMLKVEAAQATIVGPEDVYVKKGSTISLICEVNVRSTPPSSVSWHHGGAVVDFDSPRYKPREWSSQFRSSAHSFLITCTRTHIHTFPPRHRVYRCYRISATEDPDACSFALKNEEESISCFFRWLLCGIADHKRQALEYPALILS